MSITHHPSAFTPREGGRVLCFTAHPDDVDFGAAGTIAAWTAAGVEVIYCVMTDGDAGGFEAEEDIASRRVEEQRRAAALVGVETVHYLHERDGYLEPNHEVISQVVALIREYRPDVVLTMHPERNWERLQKSHPDHLAAGEIVTRAVYPAAENPFAYPELEERGLRAYKVPQLWFMAAPQERENHFVDVTGTVDVKLAAIHIHASQHPDPDAMDAQVRTQLRENGARTEAGEQALVECFHVVFVNAESTFAGF
ncbi:PIG-L deacetylase family protein [Arthrobacter woluwensis]|uniref:PIG-L deacetylase family protein n=1 Tax=Arthrobacter woluwensis TaxID=156980 RepID=UPI0021BD19B3|nr:PIG-L deacetylase family protein [Arthrobacter woluwensis]